MPAPKRNNPEDPKNPANVAAGGTPSQLAAQAAATDAAAKQKAAEADVVAGQDAAIKRQRQRAALYQGMGATRLSGGAPLGADYQGKQLLGL